MKLGGEGKGMGAGEHELNAERIRKNDKICSSRPIFTAILMLTFLCIKKKKYACCLSLHGDIDGGEMCHY